MEKIGKYKVVFQLSDNDTFVQKSLLRQLANLLAAMNDISVEVVAHSYGIDLLLEDSPFRDNITALQSQGVDFIVCENTLRQENLDRSLLLKITTTVPAGIAHIVQRQCEGWSYIKAGF
jgi:intracellular sulfur oxidation DsrE/DsrF family protein